LEECSFIDITLVRGDKRNLLVDEIGERCRLNHAIVVKPYHPYSYFPVTFAYLIDESRLFRRIVTL